MTYVISYKQFLLLKAAMLPGEDIITYINKTYLNNDVNVVTKLLIK